MGPIRCYQLLKALHWLGAPRPEFRRALLARLLANNQLSTTYRQHLRFPRLATALAVLVLIFVGTGAYAYESPNVIEGHPLFMVKKKLESARVRMARTPEDRARVHLWKMERRLREAEQQSNGAIPVQTAGAAARDPLTQAENEFKSSLDVIRSLPRAERGNVVRKVLIRPDAAHIQDLAGIALRDQRKLERVQKLLEDEQKYLEKNLDEVEDPIANRIIQKHLRVREALRDAVLTVQLEDIEVDE